MKVVCTLELRAILIYRIHYTRNSNARQTNMLPNFLLQAYATNESTLIRYTVSKKLCILFARKLAHAFYDTSGSLLGN